MKATLAIFTLIATIYVAAKEPAIYNNTKAYMVAIEAHLEALKDAELTLKLQTEEAEKRDREIAAKEEAEQETAYEPEEVTSEFSEEEEDIEPPPFREESKPKIAAKEEAEQDTASEPEEVTIEFSEEEEDIEPPPFREEPKPSAPPLEDLELSENKNTAEEHNYFGFDVDVLWEKLKNEPLDDESASELEQDTDTKFD